MPIMTPIMTESEVAAIRKQAETTTNELALRNANALLCDSHEALRQQVRDLWRLLFLFHDNAKSLSAQVLAALEKEPK